MSITEKADLSYKGNDIRFIVNTIAILFAIIFLLTETGLTAIVFATVVFVMFLKKGIDRETSAAGSSH